MLEFVDLFRDSSTVDELGIGPIRDGFSDLLFPGTSTLHTRLRYVLFIPWLMQKASDTGRPPDQQAADFKEFEYKLIRVLLSGGETAGVLGRRAGKKLKRLPSEVYQTALNRWGIVNGTSEAFFRRKAAMRQLDRSEEDDPDYLFSLGFGIDPNLPAAPEEFSTRSLGPTTFVLTHEEASYLRDKISENTAGSLFSYLINNPIDDPEALEDYSWYELRYANLPEKFHRQIDHAYRFGEFHVLAALLYNLMLAEKASRQDLIELYHESLEATQALVTEEGLANGWDRDDFWKTVAISRPNLPGHTLAFVDDWYVVAKRAVDSGFPLANSVQARALVERRERQMKGSRARLLGGPALDAWEGDSGTRLLEYRWTQARSDLIDIYRGLE